MVTCSVVVRVNYCLGLDKKVLFTSLHFRVSALLVYFIASPIVYVLDLEFLLCVSVLCFCSFYLYSVYDFFIIKKYMD